MLAKWAGRQLDRAHGSQPGSPALDRAMADDWQRALARWVAAELIDPASAAAIERWEQARVRPGLRAPILVCLGLGAVLLAAGLLLLVAAHWDEMAPGGRFGLAVAVVIALHGAAAWSSRGFPALAVALHGAGSVALGGGIFLVGQLFHLQAHWPAGLLLWAAGAGLGWGLLRQWPQLALVALLMPLWLVSEWLWRCQSPLGGTPGGGWVVGAVPSAAILLLSLTYLAAPRGRGPEPGRRVLLWLGGLALLPADLIWLLAAANRPADGLNQLQLLHGGLPIGLAALGWGTAIGGPLLLGWRLRGRSFWPLAVAVGWILAGLAILSPITPWSYAWHGLGGILLIAWGVGDGRAERINLGTALVAGTVLSFYVAEVAGRLERSLGMIGLGLLCLLGGWALEQLRRRMLARLTGSAGQGQATPTAGGPE